ncbi:MAG: hypothetical protein WDO68_21485 [Gammaproteobacteria bacterium]
MHPPDPASPDTPGIEASAPSFWRVLGLFTLHSFFSVAAFFCAGAAALAIDHSLNLFDYLGIGRLEHNALVGVKCLLLAMDVAAIVWIERWLFGRLRQALGRR